MDKFKTFIKEAAVNPQSNLTKKQRQALASPAARAKPKDQVTLAKMPWDKDKKKDEAYGCSSKRKKTEDMDNATFVLRKQARANQRRIDKGQKPFTPLHPDHKNLIKPIKKKPLSNKQFVANKQAAINKRKMRESVGMSEKSSVNYKDIDGKTVNEISKDLAKSYMKGRSRDLYFTGKKAGQDDIRSMVGAPTPSYKKGPERRASKMMKGMDMAVNKLTGKAKVPAQGKTGRNVRDQY